VCYACAGRSEFAEKPMTNGDGAFFAKITSATFDV
jgi:hypothetical protein